MIGDDTDSCCAVSAPATVIDVAVSVALDVRPATEAAPDVVTELAETGRWQPRTQRARQ